MMFDHNMMMIMIDQLSNVSLVQSVMIYFPFYQVTAVVITINTAGTSVQIITETGEDFKNSAGKKPANTCLLTTLSTAFCDSGELSIVSQTSFARVGN